MRNILFQTWLLATLVSCIPSPQDPSASRDPTLPANQNLDPLFPGTGSGRGQSNTPPRQGEVCAPDVDVVASGLQGNLDLAGGETGATLALENVLLQSGQPNADPARFNPEKMTLSGFVRQDISQMASNMDAVARGNLARPGMQRVLRAMQQASSAIQGMTGNKERDGPVLFKLKITWNNNWRQNMQNLLDVTQGCMPSDKAAAVSLARAELEGMRVTQPQDDPLGVLGLNANSTTN